MMSVKIILFASLRESLGDSGFDLDLAEGSNVSGLVEALGVAKGQQWTELLSGEKVLSAINQTMVDSEQLIQNGDEVAFFPPVTGG
jgi:molybdopterin synthase sulfur carrier subunit